MWTLSVFFVVVIGSIIIQRNFIETPPTRTVEKARSSLIRIPSNPIGAVLEVKEKIGWVDSTRYRYMTSDDIQAIPQEITDYGEGRPYVKVKRQPGQPEVVTYWEERCYDLPEGWQSWGYFMDKGCKYGGRETVVFYVSDDKVEIQS